MSACFEVVRGVIGGMYFFIFKSSVLYFQHSLFSRGLVFKFICSDTGGANPRRMLSRYSMCVHFQTLLELLGVSCHLSFFGIPILPSTFSTGSLHGKHWVAIYKIAFLLLPTLFYMT